MNNKLYGKLIFELSKEGRVGYSLQGDNYGKYEIPAAMQRAEEAQLPECDELTVVLHQSLQQQLWCRYRVLSTGFMYDEVQPQDQ